MICNNPQLNQQLNMDSAMIQGTCGQSEPDYISAPRKLPTYHTEQIGVASLLLSKARRLRYIKTLQAPSVLRQNETSKTEEWSSISG